MRKIRNGCALVVCCCLLAMGGFFVSTVLQSSPLATDVTLNESTPTVQFELTPTPVPTVTPTPKGVKTANTCSDLRVLVDKRHSLPERYVPPDLVYLKDYAIPVNTGDIRGRSVMIHDLQQMIAAGERVGAHLFAASAYRSYAQQASIYNAYVRTYGTAKANVFSAKPGQSQHQLGTAIDFTTPEIGYALSQTFTLSWAGRWLFAHAYQYGFILSYPQGQESLTQYNYEPWHYRYLGIQNVTRLRQSGLIMQKYLEQTGIVPQC